MEKYFNKTELFLLTIKDTLVQGKVNKEGYHEWAAFKLRGTLYFIAYEDAYLTKVIRGATPDDTRLTIATHKANKAGLRERYTFATAFLYDFKSNQVTIECSRLNAALLIPGGLDKLLNNPSAEVNHKATLQDNYSKQVVKTASRAYARYQYLITSGMSSIEADRVMADEYEDVYLDIIGFTDGFKRAPVYPRDNRVCNLEICSGRANRAHFKAVKEFMNLSLDAYYEEKLPASELPVEADKAEAYISGTMSRRDFIQYLKGLKPVNIGVIHEKNYPKRVSKDAERVFCSRDFRKRVLEG